MLQQHRARGCEVRVCKIRSILCAISSPHWLRLVLTEGIVFRQKSGDCRFWGKAGKPVLYSNWTWEHTQKTCLSSQGVLWISVSEKTTPVLQTAQSSTVSIKENDIPHSPSPSLPIQILGYHLLFLTVQAWAVRCETLSKSLQCAR